MQGQPSLAKKGKTTCPKCGRRTFVDYIYPDGHPVASGECGKCDRADNCGHHCPPREYFAQHENLIQAPYRPVAPMYGSQPVMTNALRKPLRFDNYRMLATLGHYDKNDLAIFLNKSFGTLLAWEEVVKTLYRYGVGTSPDGDAIYWQVDKDGRVRTGKTMAYDMVTGRRSHHDTPTWQHTSLRRSDDEAANHPMEQAFFGSHLIAEAEARLMQKPTEEQAQPVVWLFESEKGALIAALWLQWAGLTHEVVPIASGGCEAFNPKPEHLANPYHRLQALSGRTVVLFPDQGKLDKWTMAASTIKDFCLDVWINTMMETDLPHYNMHPGDGPDDVILRYIKNNLVDNLQPLLNTITKL